MKINALDTAILNRNNNRTLYNNHGITNIKADTQSTDTSSSTLKAMDLMSRNNITFGAFLHAEDVKRLELAEKYAKKLINRGQKYRAAEFLQRQKEFSASLYAGTINTAIEELKEKLGLKTFDDEPMTFLNIRCFDHFGETKKVEELLKSINPETIQQKSFIPMYVSLCKKYGIECNLSEEQIKSIKDKIDTETKKIKKQTLFNNVFTSVTKMDKILSQIDASYIPTDSKYINRYCAFAEAVDRPLFSKMMKEEGLQ